MWKRNETPESSVRPASPRVPAPPPPQPSATRIARIGGSLFIKGDLYGEEDLFIDGRIEGKIQVKKGSVTVGENGRVQADIEATNIQIAGEVHGNLNGSDQVVLLETGKVEGNIKAKSVTLENGARFKGSIDMEAAGGASKAQTSGVVSGKANGSSAVSTPPTL